jgi:hypothetical protein
MLSKNAEEVRPQLFMVTCQALDCPESPDMHRDTPLAAIRELKEADFVSTISDRSGMSVKPTSKIAR